ncbi:MAG: DUF4910 domain-containing protein [Ignavibacteriales bacterium]|nr:DUF4910 domain-containing protein [Ignavibacteriales bacterium]
MQKRLLFIASFTISFLSCQPQFRSEPRPLSSKDVSSQLVKTFDGHQALESVRYFTQFWRVGGGPGFDSCVSYIETRLRQAGMGKKTDPSSLGQYYIQEDKMNEKVWIPHEAVLSLESPEIRVLDSFAETPVMVCRNSFSTDVSAPLVYVAGGTKESDFEEVDIAQRIVLCDAHPAEAYKFALNHGALGVISSFVPPHNHPDQHPTIISENALPYDAERKPFALKVSPSTAAELKRMLSYQQVKIHVQVKTSFIEAPLKTLVAEIPGTLKPEQRIVLIAHLDHYKPGANDNASGSATLLEILRSISSGIQQGTLPKPARTLTFLWVDEYEGTMLWMKRNEQSLQNVVAAFVLDMVGGNPEKTGGTFRVERMPDPGTVWFRPPEQHSGWGAGHWNKEKLFGSFLNDFYLSVVQERCQATGWKANNNVWEGGSDHDPFLWKNIPAILSWHFPDFGYHSSLDKIDNISPTEMKNAGVSIGTASFALALGTEGTAREILHQVAKAATVRLEKEKQNTLLELSDAQAQGTTALDETKKREKEILAAWGRWYEEALRSVLTIPANSPSEIFKEEVGREIQNHRNNVASLFAALGI